MKHLPLLMIFISIILTACQDKNKSNSDYSVMTINELIYLVEHPEKGPDYQLVYAMEELEKRGTDAVEAAPALANAFVYSRRDAAALASYALVAMGPSAETVIHSMVKYLENERSDIRENAAIVLGTIGEAAECAIPTLAKLLMDSGPMVRTAAAGAIERITGLDLVGADYEIELEPPFGVVPDSDENHITEKARKWWLEEGQFQNWEISNRCDVNE